MANRRMFVASVLIVLAAIVYGCGLPTEEVVTAETGFHMEECTMDCTGRSCGADPICGEECGTCTDGLTCNEGRCVQECVPDCTGRSCGLDPLCGTSCGSCSDGLSCDSGRCVRH